MTKKLNVRINVTDFILFKLIKSKWKRWSRTHFISKRQEFVGATLLLTLGLVITQLISVDMRYQAVFVLSLMAYFLSAYVLRSDLTGIEWFTLLTLPSLFTTAISVFYFLLPERWLTRIPVAILYAVGIYAVLLTENIYNVAVNRTIALLRAAHSVGFLLTLVTFFFIAQSVFSSYSYPPFIAYTISLFAVILSIQVLWSITLGSRVEDRIIKLAIFSAVLVFQIAFFITFLPANKTVQTLYVTSIFYCTQALGQQYLMEKMYKKTVYEYAAVILIMSVLLFLSVSWYG